MPWIRVTLLGALLTLSGCASCNDFGGCGACDDDQTSGLNVDFTITSSDGEAIDDVRIESSRPDRGGPGVTSVALGCTQLDPSRWRCMGTVTLPHGSECCPQGNVSIAADGHEAVPISGWGCCNPTAPRVDDFALARRPRGDAG